MAVSDAIDQRERLHKTYAFPGTPFPSLGLERLLTEAILLRGYDNSYELMSE